MLGIYFHMQVADALRERAQRIYEKYGNVMLETEGMTKAGIERKATCRALFSKLLYLAGEPPAVHARGDIACGVSVELNSRGPALIGMPAIEVLGDGVAAEPIELRGHARRAQAAAVLWGTTAATR